MAGNDDLPVRLHQMRQCDRRVGLSFFLHFLVLCLLVTYVAFTNYYIGATELYSHYTNWNLLIQVIFYWLSMVTTMWPYYRRQVYRFVFPVAWANMIFVFIVVNIILGDNPSLIEAATASTQGFYYWGNFIAHYLPAIVIAFYVFIHSIDIRNAFRKWFDEMDRHQALMVFYMTIFPLIGFVPYVLAYDITVAYGLSIGISNWVAVAGAIVIFFLANLVFIVWTVHPEYAAPITMGVPVRRRLPAPHATTPIETPAYYIPASSAWASRAPLHHAENPSYSYS